MTPAEFAPGQVVQIQGAGLPADPANVRVVFSRSSVATEGGILGVPVATALDTISAMVPTGAPTGCIHVLGREEGTFVPQGSATVRAAPQVLGYVLPGAPRTQGNVVSLPPVAVYTDYASDDPAFAGNAIEDFASSADCQGDISTGIWGAGGVAKGLTEGRPATGAGTEPLDAAVLTAGRSYLFDTDRGKLYAFPEGVSDEDIVAVRAGDNPAAHGLVEAWAGKNAGESLGELHASTLVVPAGVTIYGRGSRPLVGRVAGQAPASFARKTFSCN